MKHAIMFSIGFVSCLIINEISRHDELVWGKQKLFFMLVGLLIGLVMLFLVGKRIT